MNLDELRQRRWLPTLFLLKLKLVTESVTDTYGNTMTVVLNGGQIMRPIDADSLIEDLELLAKHEENFRRSVILGVVHVVKARSTIDAVPVVRCKNCKYFETQLCENEDNHDDWFCADGERKDEANE